MNSASTQPATSTISLPPISSIEGCRQRTPPLLPQLPLQHHTPNSRQLPIPYATFPPRSLRDDGPSSRPIYPGAVTSSYQLPPTRVPLPPSLDPTLMIAGRAHKTKEVKRRTKTGCLTCRKRRIKCDEGRPDCRNCLKSKRECAGYDPIFHAPSAQLSAIQAIQSSRPIGTSPQPPPSNINISHSYGPPLPSSPSVSSRTTSIATESSIDPGEYSRRASDATLPPIQVPHSPQMSHPDIRQPTQTAQRYPSGSIRKARPYQTIDALCTIDGHTRLKLPPLPSDPPNLDNLRKIYNTVFAPGLNKFLETSWYTKYGFQHLVLQRDLLAQFLAYVTLVHNNPNGESAARASQEARIVWALLGLCEKDGENENNETRELANKLASLTNLVTGRSQGIQQPDKEEQSHSLNSASAFEPRLADRSRRFWWGLGHFNQTLPVQISKSSSATTSPARSASSALLECSNVLDSMENRDIIYSIMVMRHLSRQLEQFHSKSDNHQNIRPETHHLNDLDQWTIARTFLKSQARGRSTNLVCSVIAATVLRAWNDRDEEDDAGEEGKDEHLSHDLEAAKDNPDVDTDMDMQLGLGLGMGMDMIKSD